MRPVSRLSALRPAATALRLGCRRLILGSDSVLPGARASSGLAASEFVDAARRARASALGTVFALPPKLREQHPGGVLLYESTPSVETYVTSLVASSGAIVATVGMWGVLKVNDLLTLPPWLAYGGSMLGVLMSFVVAGGLRTAVRYVVLDAGGEHLWFHMMTLRSAVRASPDELRPVRVPISLLGHVTARGSSSDGKDVPSVLVSIKPSYQNVHLELFKPTALARIVGGADSGLQWGRSGVAGVVPSFGAPKGESAAPPSDAPAGPPAPWETVTAPGCVLPLADVLPRLAAHPSALLRRWAVLVHIIGGRPVSAAAVRELRARGGDWSLETLRDELEAGATGQRSGRTADLLHWHEAAARGSAGGARYWWHDVTWHRQWERPLIDGRSPDEAREEVLRAALAEGAAVEGEEEEAAATPATP